jgi:hypothetical protein
MIYNNNISLGFISNVVGSYSSDNIFGMSIQNNIFGDSFYNNKVCNNFTYNEIKGFIQNIDWTLSTPTHVIKSYPCTIFNGVADDGTTLTPVLSYFNTNMYATQFVDPTS